jgi:hypothetical protein
MCLSAPAVLRPTARIELGDLRRLLRAGADAEATFLRVVLARAEGAFFALDLRDTPTDFLDTERVAIFKSSC